MDIFVNTLTHLQPYFSPGLMEFNDFCRPQEATGGRRIQTFGACFEEADPPFWDSFGEADPPLLGSFGGGSEGGSYYESDPDTK